MHPRMTFGAERYQIPFRILPKPAARFDVVNLQLLWGAAKLAVPTVALQDFPMEFPIELRRKAFSALLGKHLIHAAAPTFSITRCLSAAGSIPRRRRTER